MIFGDRFIKRMIRKGIISNTTKECIGPASLDVRLGNSYREIVPVQEVTLGQNGAAYKTVYTDSYKLMPGAFVLATTRERFNLPKGIAAYVQGRSSCGRIGLQTQNAGYVDPGFEGEITLELKNDSPNPINLRDGFRVAQMCFHRTIGVKHPYKGKYQHQSGATGSKIHEDSID